MLPSSIKPTNWASFMMVATGGCMSAVLVSVLSVMPGLEMGFLGYTHSTFFPFTCRLSVVCFLRLFPGMAQGRGQGIFEGF